MKIIKFRRSSRNGLDKDSPYIWLNRDHIIEVVQLTYYRERDGHDFEIRMASGGIGYYVFERSMKDLVDHIEGRA